MLDQTVPAAPEPPPPPRIPRRLVVRFLLLILVVGTGFALLRWSPLADYLTGETLIATFERLRSSWWAPAALIAAYVVLSPLGVPASPMMITGGLVFGTAFGFLYNLTGCVLGGGAAYFLGRLLGRDFVVHLAGKRLKKVERVIARRGFWGMVAVRFLPLPFPVLNYCAALAGVPPGRFLASTAVGIAPGVLLFTYFSDTLSKAATGDRSGIYLQLGAVILLLLLLSFVPPLWTGWRRRVKYREAIAQRRGRVPSSYVPSTASTSGRSISSAPPVTDDEGSNS